MAAAAANDNKATTTLNDPLLNPLGTSSSSTNTNTNTNTNSNHNIATTTINDNNISNEIVDDNIVFESWLDKQPRILKEFSTSSRVAVTASFLEDDVIQNIPATDKTISRLEELETTNPKTTHQKNYLSQKEYITHMEEQHSRLKRAWEIGERVVSLKIAIQCAKLLGDTSVPQFYPSMYILLGNILDTFGDLVYDRLKSLATKDQNIILPYDFTCDHVSHEAQITCKNWFYKTACIRELIPRLYIDLALIKSYRFITKDDYSLILKRLSKTIRGIGDPLTAIYARCYLANKARQLNYLLNPYHIATTLKPLKDSYKQAILEAYDDFMFTIKALHEHKFQGIKVIDQQILTINEYMFLFSPALEWILQNIAYGSTKSICYALFEQYKAYYPHAVILYHLLGAYKHSNFINEKALTFIELIKNCIKINQKLEISKLYLQLGKSLQHFVANKADEKLTILNEIWNVVTNLTDILEYLEIANVFIQFLIRNFNQRQVNIFLKDIIKHSKAVTKEIQNKAKFQSLLTSIVLKLIKYSADNQQLLFHTLSMDNFLSAIDLLHSNSKISIAKLVLTTFNAVKTETNNPIIIHTLLDVSKSLHFSIDAQSFDDEVRQISLQIINMISLINFYRDLEAQLNFYMDCRNIFTRLTSVNEFLIIKVLLLASRALKMMKYKHTKKTLSFVKSCIAYGHITIPCLKNTLLMFKLYNYTAEISLQNGLITQAESLLKSALSLIKDIPAFLVIKNQEKIATTSYLISYITSLCSLLLIFPGHPKHGPFYLVQGLINAIQNYPLWKAQDVIDQEQGT